MMVLFAALVLPVQVVVPQGIESVNGSSLNMGCTSSLVDSGGVMICNRSQNYLVDGCSPAIDTSTSDWASQLVTVRKTYIEQLDSEHVLLTFGFDTAVRLIRIEMDLFLCPDWGISTPYINVYADVESNLNFSYDHGSLDRLPQTQYGPIQFTSCDSLSTLHTGQKLDYPIRP